MKPKLKKLLGEMVSEVLDIKVALDKKTYSKDSTMYKEGRAQLEILEWSIGELARIIYPNIKETDNILPNGERE